MKESKSDTETFTVRQLDDGRWEAKSNWQAPSMSSTGKSASEAVKHAIRSSRAYMLFVVYTIHGHDDEPLPKCSWCRSKERAAYMRRLGKS